MRNNYLFLLLALLITFSEICATEGLIKQLPAGSFSLVKDINKSGDSNPTNLVSMNGFLFFTAYNSQGIGLWRTNGTPSGTFLLKIIGTGHPIIANINGILFFTVYDTVNGNQIWKTDGTKKGCSFIKRLRIYSATITNVNGTAFFTSGNSSTGIELWKSDGTEAGTTLVKDIWPGQFSSKPSNLINVNGTLFFAATEPKGGRELWKSDGTPEGTIRVKNISAGRDSSDPTNFKNFYGNLFFVAAGELWKSDGTATGTTLVFKAQIHAATNFAIVGRFLTFAAFSKNKGCSDTFLFKTAGTTDGTEMIKSSNRFECGPYGVSDFGVIGRTLFFSAYSQTADGGELWRSDLTDQSTVLVKDINPGDSSFLYNLTNYNGILFFRATTAKYGTELWRSDGTEKGTMMVKDLFPGMNGSIPQHLTVLNDVLFFSATTPAYGTELWKYEMKK